jgi:hypothetical protein
LLVHLLFAHFLQNFAPPAWVEHLLHLRKTGLLQLLGHAANALTELANEVILPTHQQQGQRRWNAYGPLPFRRLPYQGYQGIEAIINKKDAT